MLFDILDIIDLFISSIADNRAWLLLNFLTGRYAKMHISIINDEPSALDKCFSTYVNA